MSSNSLMLTQLILLLMAIMAKITQAINNLKDCEDRCGNVSIPYPFGMQEGCYRSKEFYINCNTGYTPPKPFLRKSNIEVTEVSLLGQIRLLQYVAKQCYYDNGTRVMQGNRRSYTTLGTYMTYNSSMNKLIAVGCDSYALIEGYYLGQLYRTGCISSCTSVHQLQATNGHCSGVGCCQIPIPTGIWNVNISVGSYNRYRGVTGHDVDRYSYAFVAGENEFNFTSAIHIQLENKEKLSSVADWFIGNTPCAKDKNLSSYACKSTNSQCYEPFTGSNFSDYYYLSGYRCSCMDGFQGNPYIEGGCKDIDECQAPYRHNRKKNSLSNNTYGNYTCTCLDGFQGDGREGCNPNPL